MVNIAPFERPSSRATFRCLGRLSVDTSAGRNSAAFSSLGGLVALMCLLTADT